MEHADKYEQRTLEINWEDVWKKQMVIDYELQREFWKRQPPNIEGSLQNNHQFSGPDLELQHSFFRDIKPRWIKRDGVCLEVACGSGRVT